MEEKKIKSMKLRNYYYQLGYKMLEFNAYTHTANVISIYYIAKDTQHIPDISDSHMNRIQSQFEYIVKTITTIYAEISELPMTNIAQFEKQLLKSDQIEIKFEEIYKIVEDYCRSMDKICDGLKSVGKAKDLQEKLSAELITLKSHLNSVTNKTNNHYFIWKLWFLTGLIADNCLNTDSVKYIEIVETIVPCYELIFNKIRSLCIEKADSITISPEDDFMYFDEVPNVDFDIKIAK